MKRIFFLFLIMSSVVCCMQPNQPEINGRFTYRYHPDHEPLELESINSSEWEFGSFLFVPPHRTRRLIAAYDQQKIVGAISFAGAGIEASRIHFLEVMREYRNQQIGRELTKRAIVQLLTNKTCCAVQWTAFGTAAEFYEKSGYLPVNNNEQGRSDFFVTRNELSLINSMKKH